MSRPPRTSDWTEQMCYCSKLIRGAKVTLNLYLISSPSKALLEDNFSRDMFCARGYGKRGKGGEMSVGEETLKSYTRV